jgi:hypothetical protein
MILKINAEIGKFNEYIFKTLDPTFKGAVLRYSIEISYINQVNINNYTLKILNEAFFTNQFVFYFTQNFYLVDEVNEKISQFHSSGLINFWMTKYSIDDHKIRKEFPSSFTVKKFEGIFEILSFGWFLATGVFILEFLLNYV